MIKKGINFKQIIYSLRSLRLITKKNVNYSNVNNTQTRGESIISFQLIHTITVYLTSIEKWNRLKILRYYIPFLLYCPKWNKLIYLRKKLDLKRFNLFYLKILKTNLLIWVMRYIIIVNSDLINMLFYSTNQKRGFVGWLEFNQSNGLIPRVIISFDFRVIFKTKKIFNQFFLYSSPENLLFIFNLKKNFTKIVNMRKYIPVNFS